MKMELLRPVREGSPSQTFPVFNLPQNVSIVNLLKTISLLARTVKELRTLGTTSIVNKKRWGDDYEWFFLALDESTDVTDTVSLLFDESMSCQG
jgi:hypothetical protein